MIAWLILEKALRICLNYGMTLQYNRFNFRSFCVYSFDQR